MKTIKKKLLIGAGILILTIVAVCGFVYGGLTIYYQKNYAANTWINGYYCAGKTVDEVNAALLAETEIPEFFTVTAYDRVGADAEPAQYRITLSDIGYWLDYRAELEEYMRNQSPATWKKNLHTEVSREILPRKTYDDALLREWWDSQIGKLYDASEDYGIAYTDGTGYTVYDSIYNRLDTEKAYGLIGEALTTGTDQVDLIASECYYDAPMDAEQKETAALWNRVEFYQSNGPIYDFDDEKLVLDAGQMSAFLLKDPETQLPVQDETGTFQIDMDAVTLWLQGLAEKYDTYGREWDFSSTRGEIIKVKGVTYGTTINQKRELVWLEEYLNALAAGNIIEKQPEEITTVEISADTVVTGDNAKMETVVAANTPADPAQAATGGSGELETLPNYENRLHVAEYSKDAYNHSGTSIGDTYIEVDMGLQKLYYYEDGELKLEADTVTGNARRRMDTPEGVNFVYSKQKNRVLRGENYASPVKFWMPVVKAVGIHDARWRDEFGGEIYKTNGSHGCVNIPLEKAAELYDMVEIGTPVIMFYGEDNS